MTDRRALFFLGASLVVALLIPLTDDEFRFVPIGLALVYAVLAIASFLDHRSRQSMAEEEDRHSR